MDDPAIRTVGLTKDYGATRALSGLDLEVESGQVYAFLGPNGSGKSTTIRLLLDLIRPTSGRAEVLGLDPRSAGVELRRRIGYLPGDFEVDGRQTSVELLTYLGNLRGGVRAVRIEELADQLALDLNRPIKTLSKGNRQKVGLIQAAMHEPELLIMDEPTSGLDPFFQHMFVDMVRQVVSDGRTVFLSSHVLSEVQQVADQVGVIRNGELVTVERIDALRHRSLRDVSIEFAEPVHGAEFSYVAGVNDVRVEGRRLTCRLDGDADALIKTVAAYKVKEISIKEPDLDELFYKYYEREEVPADDAPKPVHEMALG